MKILVSACLMGQNCKYNGGNNYSETLLSLTKGHELIPICPETAGGLSTPRTPCEIVEGEVRTRDGESRDRAFREGARLCLEIAKEQKIDLAILQSRSPSCGVNQIYDGSFSGKLIPGSGVFAALLQQNGFRVLDVSELTEAVLERREEG